MIRHVPKTTAFWSDLEREVETRVIASLADGHAPRDRLIADLRDLERMARKECDRRQTIQILASARRLLQDRMPIGPSDGPFAHAL